MAAFLAIVDGTGCWSNERYKRAMAASFCRQLFEKSSVTTSYLRGPSGEGYYIEVRAQIVVDEIVKARADQIFLAGYSRGASAVVIAAEMLARRGLAVKALFLFDPVARHGSASSEVIPANVSAVYTARRIIGAKEMDKYDYVLLGDLAGHNPVRNWFGTTATKFASVTTAREERTFLGSHGALGGVGWKGISEDGGCQVAVADFFNKALRSEGLDGVLVSAEPTALF